MKQHQRRCKSCIESNREVSLKPHPENAAAKTKSSSEAHPGASCWICLEDGHDDLGQPLRRDCSCRGESAGFAHLSCYIEYAEQKSRYMRSTMGDITEPWNFCPNCRQPFMNNLFIDLAMAYEDFVNREYPDNAMFRHSVFQLKMRVFRQADKREEACNLAREMLSTIEKMKDYEISFGISEWK